MVTSTILSEADLHGLVDGVLDPGRRAEILRRAAASPRDRALVETWQDQNDAIRLAFAGVERELLPAELDLRLIGPLDGPAATPDRRLGRTLKVASMAGAIVGLLAAWETFGFDLGRLAASAPPGGLRGADGAVSSLPTTTIPDLGPAGFSFIGASVKGSDGLVFRYGRGATDRVSISAVRSPAPSAAPGGDLVWRVRGVVFEVSGTLSSEGLRAIALLARRV